MCFEKDHPYKSLRTSIKQNNYEHIYYDVSQLNPRLFAQLPFCLRILLESTVRHCNNLSIENKHVQQILNWQENTVPIRELPFLPSQVIMHDFSGLPAIIDLAAMRDAAVRLGSDPHVIQPKVSTTLLLDCYNIEADVARKIVRRTTDTKNMTSLECGYELCPFHDEKTICADALERNQQLEFQRNIEKLQIMKVKIVVSDD